jgi:hypothetical protein
MFFLKSGEIEHPHKTSSNWMPFKDTSMLLLLSDAAFLHAQDALATGSGISLTGKANASIDWALPGMLVAYQITS